MMMSEFKVIDRPAEPFAAIRISIPLSQISAKAPPLIPEVEAWIRAAGLKQSGPAFFNYVGMQADGRFDIDVGAATTRVGTPDARVATGTLPSGRYAAVTWTGPYDGLHDVHMALGDWIGSQGHRIAQDDADGAYSGGTRLEIYVTDPIETPDPSAWITEVRFRLAD